jgi:hypothetical protein
MILPDRFWSMHVFCKDPFVVALRESFPFDQILKASLSRAQLAPSQHPRDALSRTATTFFLSFYATHIDSRFLDLYLTRVD